MCKSSETGRNPFNFRPRASTSERPLTSRSDTKLIERLCSEDRTLEKALKLFESLKTLEKFQGRTCLPNVCALIASEALGTLEVGREAARMASSVSEEEFDIVWSEVRAHLPSSEQTVSFAAIIDGFQPHIPERLVKWMNTLYKDYQYGGTCIHGPDILTFAVFYWSCSLFPDTCFDLDEFIEDHDIKEEPLRNVIKSLGLTYSKLKEAVTKATQNCTDKNTVLTALNSVPIETFLVHSASSSRLSSSADTSHSSTPVRKSAHSTASFGHQLQTLPTLKRTSATCGGSPPAAKRPRLPASQPTPSRELPPLPRWPRPSSTSSSSISRTTVAGERAYVSPKTSVSPRKPKPEHVQYMPARAGQSPLIPSCSRSASGSPEIQIIENPNSILRPSLPLPLPRGPGPSKPSTTTIPIRHGTSVSLSQPPREAIPLPPVGPLVKPTSLSPSRVSQPNTHARIFESPAPAPAPAPTQEAVLELVPVPVPAPTVVPEAAPDLVPVVPAVAVAPPPVPVPLPMPALSSSPSSSVPGINNRQHQLNHHIALASSAIIAHVEQHGCEDMTLEFMILDLRTRRIGLEHLCIAPAPPSSGSSPQQVVGDLAARLKKAMQIVRKAEDDVVGYVMQEGVQRALVDLDMELLYKILDLKTRLEEGRKVADGRSEFKV